MAFDSERCQQIIEESIKEFSKEYTIGYLKAVVQKVKDETEGSGAEAPRLLQTAPVAEYQKMGFMTKKGAVVKNWKRRWFVVDKEFRIAYYKGQDDHVIQAKTEKSKKKAAGEFSCFGYKIKKCDEDGFKADKEFTLKVAPYWSDDVAKRTYYFTCDNKDDYDAWKKQLQDCCYRAPNPMHKDPVRRAAFEAAYKALRNYYWFWPTGSEGDMLAYIIFLRVKWEVLNDAYAKVPDNPMRSKIIGKMDGAVGAMIGPPVDAAWKVACAAIDQIEKPTEEKIREAVGPLFETVKKMKDAVQAKFDEKVVPVIAKLMEPVKDKLVKVVSEPMIKAQKDLIEEFIKHKGSRSSWNLYWDLRKREKEYDDILSIARAILDEPDLWDLPGKIMESCFNLLEAATYTYNNVDGSDVQKTANRLYHDCLVEQNVILTWLVETIVLKPFNEAFGTIVDELVGPLEELIPEALAEFLSPSDTIKEMANNAMASAIQACIAPDPSSPVDKKLQSYFADAGTPIDLAAVASLEGTAATEESKESKEEEAPKDETRARGASLVPKEAVDSDSDTEEKTPDTGDAIPSEAPPEAPTEAPAETAAA